MEFAGLLLPPNAPVQRRRASAGRCNRSLASPTSFPLHDYAAKAARKSTARRVGVLVVYK